MTTAANAPAGVQAAPAKPQRKRYHVGLKLDGPIHHGSAGGVGFVRYTYLPGEKEGEPDLPRRGDVVKLTLDQVDRVRRSLARKVYRRAPWGWMLLDKASHDYFPEDGDRLMADFTWVRELRDDEEPGLAEPSTIGELERARQAEQLQAKADEAETLEDPAEAEAAAKVAAAKRMGATLTPAGEIEFRKAARGK